MKDGFSSLIPAAAALSLLVMAPAARAQDFSMDDSCPASPGLSTVLTTGFSVPSNGGGCHPFSNDTGSAITSIEFQMLLVPGSTPPVVGVGPGSYECDTIGTPVFAFCNITFDPNSDLLTFRFSINPDRPSPVPTGGEIDFDLRNPCSPLATSCNPSDPNNPGGWVGGQAFAIGLNGAAPPALAPEPGTGVVAALALGVLGWVGKRNGVIRFSK